MRLFLIVIISTLFLQSCSFISGDDEVQLTDKERLTARVIDVSPLAENGVTSTEINIGVSLDLLNSTNEAMLAGFEGYLDSINTRHRGMDGRKYVVQDIDNGGNDSIVQIENIRNLANGEDGEYEQVLLFGLVESESLLSLSEIEFSNAKLAGFTSVSESFEHSKPNNIVTVDVSDCDASQLDETVRAIDYDSVEKDAYGNGWDQAYVVDQIILAAAKKGDITRPAIAAMAENFDQEIVC